MSALEGWMGRTVRIVTESGTHEGVVRGLSLGANAVLLEGERGSMWLSLRDAVSLSLV